MFAVVTSVTVEEGCHGCRATGRRIMVSKPRGLARIELLLSAVRTDSMIHVSVLIPGAGSDARRDDLEHRPIGATVVVLRGVLRFTQRTLFLELFMYFRHSFLTWQRR
jgi:hypothetical protein